MQSHTDTMSADMTNTTTFIGLILRSGKTYNKTCTQYGLPKYELNPMSSITEYGWTGWVQKPEDNKLNHPEDNKLNQSEDNRLNKNEDDTVSYWPEDNKLNKDNSKYWKAVEEARRKRKRASAN